MAFTHLHVHTEYSLLDGSNKIKEYVARVKELGMNSAAITDHGVMYGVIDFYRAAREAGIKPILGCEVYVAPNSRFDKELTGGEDRYHHLVLLAENNTGYANLMKIVSRGFTEGYYYKPRVDMEVLQEFHEGIIALSACLAGEVPRFILKGMKDEARKAARKYEACFGKGNYFLELQDHGIPEQRTVNMELLQMSRELDIPLVTTNDVHYTYAEDAIPHDILLCLQTGKKLADEDRMRYEGGQYYVKSEEEMKGLFPYAWEAVENTGEEPQDYRVVSLGIDPAAALYHGFYCLDGYSNNYSLEYKHRFREIIAPELDKSEYLEDSFDHWGNRCYLFSAECPGYYTIEKGGFYFQDYTIDAESLRQLGGSYLLSAAYIDHSEDTGLELMRPEAFETENSYYRIYLYRVMDNK